MGCIHNGSIELMDGCEARLDEMPKAPRRAATKHLNDYAADGSDPKQDMAKAYQSGNYTMQAIAQQFGVHYSTVSRAVKAAVMK